MRDKASIFVGNLAMFCTESDIKAHFSSCGEITDVSIKSDPKTGRQLSYGFVRFSKEKHAKIALDTMNGSLLCGRSLRLNFLQCKLANVLILFVLKDWKGIEGEI